MLLEGAPLLLRPLDGSATLGQIPRHPKPCLHARRRAQVDFTFTAEGTDAGPNTLSFRGLDHAIYYRPNANGVRSSPLQGWGLGTAPVLRLGNTAL